MSSLQITPVHSIEECRVIEHLIAQIWQCPPDQIVPDHMIITFAHNNGVVLLARLDGQPVGFAFGFPSWHDNYQLHHHSHMAGVLPGLQDKGIATELKFAQRAAVLAQGLKRMTWTFDPLLTRNASLNLRKLGTVCRTYRRNVYGELQDAYNAGGIPTDRFYLEWFLDSPHVNARLQGKLPPRLQDWLAHGVSVANPPRLQGEYPLPLSASPDWQAERLLVAVPGNYVELRQRDSALALEWRIHTREVFETAFANGLWASALFVTPELCYYGFQRSASDWLTD